jgi:flagellar M-ring protein FliF
MSALVQTFKDMGRVKLGVFAGAAVILIALFIYISMRISSPLMSPLYSGLSIEDSAKIVEQLDQQNIPYELRSNGTQILISSDQVLRTRLNLAQQGMPSGGSIVGYEIFDRAETLGTSNVVMNINMLRALEGELARTIASFQQVESARVHLVIPKRELFTREKQDPSASVALKLRGADMEKSEIRAIQNLVATAVPGLKTSHITIVDSTGQLLAKGSGEGESGMGDSDAQEYRVGFENRMKTTLEALLDRSLGAGKAKVTVNADIDFDRIITNSEKFDPESQVARSVQTNVEKENSSDKNSQDNVSVANNIPNPPGNNQESVISTRNSQKNEETTNFEISKVTQNHVKEMGTVKRMSVAVLVDGIYSENASGEQVYAPRAAAELKQIETLVRSAVGFDEKRNDVVEVVNMRFSPDGSGMFEESWFDRHAGVIENIVQAVVLGLVGLLALLLVVRPLVNRLIESVGPTGQNPLLAGAGLSGQPALTAGGFDSSGNPLLPGQSAEDEDEESMINIDRVKGRVKSSMYRKINELIDKHPDETLTIVRQWVFKE